MSVLVAKPPAQECPFQSGVFDQLFHVAVEGDRFAMIVARAHGREKHHVARLLRERLDDCRCGLGREERPE
jgi:hypothetical protein